MGREASTCRRSGKPLPASVQKSNAQESRKFTKNLGDKGALAGVRVSRIEKNKRLRFFYLIFLLWKLEFLEKNKNVKKIIVSNFFRSVVNVFFFYSFALSLVFLLWFPSSFSVAETAEFYNCCCRHDECSMGSEKTPRVFLGVLLLPSGPSFVCCFRLSGVFVVCCSCPFLPWRAVSAFVVPHRCGVFAFVVLVSVLFSPLLSLGCVLFS